MRDSTGSSCAEAVGVWGDAALMCDGGIVECVCICVGVCACACVRACVCVCVKC